jgi:hypothetical protein
MRIGFIILGAVLLGLAWWMTQPLQTSLFGLFPVELSNPLRPLSFPAALTGLGSCVYGFLSERKKR